MAARVTLRDVARVAGVSRTTASNVIMGTGRASDETRDRVRQAMAELGYVYNQAAAALRRQTSNVVGVVVTNIHRPHFGALLIGIESTLTEAGYTPLMVSTMDSLERQERAVATLREHGVAGLAMIPATGSGDALLDSLDDWGVPAVFVSRYVRDRDRPYAGPDDVHGGRLAAEHLLQHGCRSIAYVGGDARVNSRRDRIDGVLSAIGASAEPIDFTEYESEPSGEGGLAIGRRIIEEGALPDGVLCHGDATALGFLRALHDAGRAGEVRVVGYDGIAAARYSIPALTTVETDAFELGSRAGLALLTAITSGEQPASFTQEPRLVIRESCGDHER